MKGAAQHSNKHCGNAAAKIAIYHIWYIIPTAVDRADSSGRRNTLIVEVCGGEDGLVPEDQ